MLPNDPVMLLSYVNTQLRDCYQNLDEMCKCMCVEKEEIESKLEAIDYEYHSGMNRFV